MIETIDQVLERCERLHGHLCAGQILGARMAALGCDLIGIKEPEGIDGKKLIICVEIDRCMADAVSAATGVRLGRRTLKYFDYGKVAATFLNTATNVAFRIYAYDEARSLADLRHPEIQKIKERQFRTYREARVDELFKIERVEVIFNEMDLPGRPRSRMRCVRCEEGINDGREIIGVTGEAFCRPCANGGYYMSSHGSDNA